MTGDGNVHDLDRDRRDWLALHVPQPSLAEFAADFEAGAEQLADRLAALILTDPDTQPEGRPE